MTKAKKNSGCINCEHLRFHGGCGSIYEVCESGLVVEKPKVDDYLHGTVDGSMAYYPPRENKTLTCKGHTPIDWKARYDKLKEGQKVDESLYVPNKTYQWEINRVEDLKTSLSFWKILATLGVIATLVMGAVLSSNIF